MFEPVNNFSHSNICSWQTVILLVFFAFYNSEEAIEGITPSHNKTEPISITRPRELFMVARCERFQSPDTHVRYMCVCL